MGHEHVIRPALEFDNLRTIASLIYRTDPYIYPFWFGREAQAIAPISQLIRTPGSICARENIFVAKDLHGGTISGIIVAASTQSRLDYDYSELKQTNDRFRFAIKHYVEPAVQHVRELSPETLYLFDFCIAPDRRNRGLGKMVLSDFMRNMKRRGFKRFELDCLVDNLPALVLYHKLGFQGVKSDLGFNGPGEPRPEIITLVYQS